MKKTIYASVVERSGDIEIRGGKKGKGKLLYSVKTKGTEIFGMHQLDNEIAHWLYYSGFKPVWSADNSACYIKYYVNVLY